MYGVIPPQEEDLAFLFPDLSEIPIKPILQSSKVPLNSELFFTVQKNYLLDTIYVYDSCILSRDNSRVKIQGWIKVS